MKLEIIGMPSWVTRSKPLSILRSRKLPAYHNTPFTKQVRSRPVASTVLSTSKYASAFQKPATIRLMDQFNVQGKVFIVTGGGRGVGLMMAEGIAEAGGKGIRPKSHTALIDFQSLTTSSRIATPEQNLQVVVHCTTSASMYAITMT